MIETINQQMQSVLSIGLWLAGLGHFIVLIASFQVPFRLGWKKDLAKLNPFNRKLMWTSGGFTVLTISAFGLMTLFYHSEFVNGSPVAIGLAAFISTFWIVRILIDIFCFRHDEWPKGPGFLIGHILLTTLFVLLAGVYLGLVVWHVWY